MTRKKKKRSRKRNSGCNRDDYKLDFVECTFTVNQSYNVPRITARLEGLMGTNIVRLTDRTYMQRLRQNHEADCITRLQERIDKRKAAEKERQNYLIFRGHYNPENCPNFLKIAHSVALNQEMERVRNLVVQGNLAKVPQELATHPVFVVNQKTNDIITQRRSKLKTNREKNSERLIRQGAKWERQRLIFEQLEKEKEQELKARRHEQSGLEEQYRNEDAIRGIELLRIHDKKWKPCELDLKKFLETENALMKQRFVRKSVQYSSDPMDFQNVVLARKKFRETEERIRKCLEDQMNQSKEISTAKEITVKLQTASNICRDLQPGVEGLILPDMESHFHSDYGLQSNEDLSAVRVDYQFGTTANNKYAFQNEMEGDIQQEPIIPKEQFDTLHYEDPLIALLKKTENVHDLYKVARDVVCMDSNQIVEKIPHDETSST